MVMVKVVTLGFSGHSSGSGSEYKALPTYRLNSPRVIDALRDL